MNSDALDSMLDDLEEMMPPAPGFAFLGVRRHDWRPFWARAAEVQALFKDAHYPSKELREAAWRRFNALRDEASKRAKAERAQLEQVSHQHLRHILSECFGIGYSKIADDTLFFFDKTTVEEMKARGRYLSAVMKYLSEHKHEMLGEHKKEAFERIQQVKEEHDLFWHRQLQAREYRTADRIRRIEANIEKNRAILANAMEALARQRSRTDDLRQKIEEGSSDKWMALWSEWLAEAESKIEDIESSMARIKG